MLNINWNEFDTKVNNDDLKSISNDTNKEFVKLPHGEYIVSIASILMTKSQAGRPMLKVKFRVVEGEHTDKCIFMFQVCQTPLQIDICDKFLKSLKTDQNVFFENYKDYAELIKKIYFETKDKMEFKLKYSANKKGYDTFKIVEVYDI